MLFFWKFFMMLMVDMGNSALKWANLEQGRLSPQQRIPHQANNLEKLLTQAWRTLDMPSQGVWVSNVAGPQKAETLSHWVKTLWGLKPTFVKTSRYECGVKNGYENPEQLGVDRWLALIGAHLMEKGMLCIVDCGTAITLDVLSANGHHQGGLIMPGVTTMQIALKSDTYALAHSHPEKFFYDDTLRGLPNFESLAQKFSGQPAINKTFHQHHDNSFLAHNTHTGMTLGTLYAVIGLLEYVIKTLEKQGNQIILILTGGSVPVLESFLPRPYRHIPDLVLQGLKAVVDQSL